LSEAESSENREPCFTYSLPLNRHYWKSQKSPTSLRRETFNESQCGQIGQNVANLSKFFKEKNWLGDCLGHFCGHWAIFSQKHLVTLTGWKCWHFQPKNTFVESFFLY
jgi:hypothetical protein